MKILLKCAGYFSILFLIINIFPSYKDNSNKTVKSEYYLDSTFEFVQDIRGENIFVFSIHPQLPSFRFILIGDSEFNWIDEIKIYKGNDSIPIQIINDEDELNSEPPLKGVEYFYSEDYNFDGYKDIAFLKFWGATGNLIYCIWLYDKLNELFKSNNFFKYIYTPTLDYKKKQLTTFNRYGGAYEYQLDTYQFVNDKYTLVKVEKYWVIDEKNRYYPMRDILEMINHKLKLISRDTL